MKTIKMFSLLTLALSQNLFAGQIPADEMVWECVSANHYFKITARQDIQTARFGQLILNIGQEFEIESLGENERSVFSAVLESQNVSAGVTKHAVMASYKLSAAFGGENLTLTLFGIDESVRQRCQISK